MANCSPRSNRILGSEVDKMLKQLQQMPSIPRYKRAVSRMREPAASNKHIQSVDVPMTGAIRRRMSTQVKTPSPDSSFLEQFEKQVTSQRQAIHLLRNQSIKENARHINMNVKEHVMDIVDWIKMRNSSQKGLGDTAFQRQHDTLQKLINRNNKALNYFVRNRSELIEISLTKELRKLG